MDWTSREVAAVIKLCIAVFFGGMAMLFRAANRKDDARRLEAAKKFEAELAKRPVSQLSPLEKLRADYSTLFTLSENPRRRGELLVDVFNRLFDLGDVSVTQAFERPTDEMGKKIDEQIEGVVKLDDNLYLVELHWEDAAIGDEFIQDHLKLLRSGQAGSPIRGVIISFSGFTELAIKAAREAAKAGDVVILCTLADFTHILEGEAHLDAFMRTRVHIAAIDKNPYASYAW
jgi:restriction system protein